jgi:glucose uptake protein
MVIVSSYPWAVVLCIITMLCWGSWANTQKLATKKWPFQLFYWDYSLGVVILSLIFALTLGSIGDKGRDFFSDLSQASFNAIILAILGGIIFNLANILLVAAIDIAGMAVAFPVGIGLALVIGVITNYIGAPVGNFIALFTGVLLVTIAIVFDAIAYRKKQPTGEKTIKKGLIISIFAGILMGFFYRFVAASMVNDFVNPEMGKLTPYSASFIFSLGLFVSNFLWNTIIMYRPISGEKTNYKDYFLKGNVKLHFIGILGGIIWCLGFISNIIAAGEAGFAISYGLGQGATMVAALWGVFIWKEFKGVKGTKALLSFMFLLFFLGLGLIIVARFI